MNKKEYLNEMGITVFKMKTNISDSSEKQNLSHDINDWTSLEVTAKNCTLCDLCKTRTQVVFGVGDKHAKLMVIGEGPGENEDKQGEPFVGAAGQLLNKILAAIQLSREQVYIANVVKCRPPNNREPKSIEVESCTPYLKQQIALIQPKLIVALGRVAAHFLLNTETALGKMRGETYQYEKIPLMVTYHPAYLLRNPDDKKKAWEDWQKIRDFLLKI